MSRFGIAGAVAASLLLLSASACGGNSPPNALADAVPASEITAKDFDPKSFSRPAEADHKWFPLRPGTQLWFRGSTLEDGKRVMHRQVFTVTDLTKVIRPRRGWPG